MCRELIDEFSDDTLVLGGQCQAGSEEVDEVVDSVADFRREGVEAGLLFDGLSPGKRLELR